MRNQILNGKLTLPTIYDLRSAYPEAYPQLENMFASLWRAYLAKGSKATISNPYWAKRIANPKAHNIALKMLSEAGWITVSTQPNRNWSETSLNTAKLLNYVTQAELDRVRTHHKFDHYKLGNPTTNPKCAYLTSTKGKVSDTGLYRPGFAKTATTQFQFDTVTMANYEDTVTDLINYGIEKMITSYPSILEDHANYLEVGSEMVQHYIHNPETYSAGDRTSDPRGRNNAGYLDKIGNPVGFKIMRSLLVIPEANRNIATSAGLEAKLLFIAELVGFKKGSKSNKVAFGKQCYLTREFHQITLPQDIKEVPENLWLERLYADLDNLYATLPLEDDTELLELYSKFTAYHEVSTAWHKQRLTNLAKSILNKEASILDQLGTTYKWTTPIELDMSASIAGIMGLILNHQPFMERTNMLDGDLQDAWAHPVVTNRELFKSVIMRKAYGSQQSAASIASAMNIKSTPEDNLAMEKELQEGEMAVANAFKDFLINNAQMQPTMDITILGNTHTMTCNHHFNVGDKTTKFDLYDTNSKSVKRIQHTDTVTKPDLKRFATSAPTMLIHGLDPIAMDATVDAVMDQFNWAIDIHDAIICCCEAAPMARRVFAKQLENIHTNRKSILQDFFKSIGIGASKQSEWNTLVKPLIKPYKGTFKCNHMVLK